MYKYVTRFLPIESKDNPKLTAAVKLSDKKYRRECSEFFVEGIKLFREAMDSNYEVARVFVTSSAADRYEELTRLEALDIPVFVIPDRLYLRLSEENAPQGIFTVIRQRHPQQDIFLPGLMLCDVRDPGNVGTIIRTACAFGIKTVLLSDGCADIYSPKTLRASMGGIFRINTVLCGDSMAAIDKIKTDGASVYAAALSASASDIMDINITPNTLFVLGNEGVGISPEVIQVCTDSVIIPLEPNSESLNVAACGAVVMWEIRRRLSEVK